MPSLRQPLFFLVCACFPAVLSAQTIFTEDFETPVTTNYFTFTPSVPLITASATWQITQNSIDLYRDAARPEAAAYDGTQAVDLTGSPGEGVMETVIATTPGVSYDLVFHYARNLFIDPSIARARVDVIGIAPLLVDSVAHDPAMHVFSQYVQYSAIFTADSVHTTLRFSGLNPGVAGVTLDGISIEVNSTTAASPLHPRADTITNVRPNPFNPVVSIEYATTQPGTVTITIYNVRGELVQTLLDEDRGAGSHLAAWNGTDRRGQRVASGVYIAVLQTPRGLASRRLVLLK